MIKINKKNLIIIENIFSYIFLLIGSLGLIRVFRSQEVVNINNGFGWDGVQYQRLLDFFIHGKFLGNPAEFPFCFRIGTPWLVSLFNGFGIGFYEINIISGFLLIPIIIYCTSKYSIHSLKSFVGVIFVTSFLYFSPLKFSNFYPAYTDPVFMLIIAISALFAIKEKYIISLIFCVLAIPFREAAFYIMPLVFIIIFFRSNDSRKKIYLSIAILFIGFIIKILLLKITDCESKSQISVGFSWALQFISNPNRFISSIAALIMTIGPIFLIMKKEYWDFFIKSKGGFLAIISIPYFSVLAIVGGSDVTRIFYSFFPFYILLIAFCFKQSSLSSFTTSIFGYIITNQILLKYKQPITDFPDNDMTGFFSQFPDHSHPVVGLIILSIWTILYIITKKLEIYEDFFLNSNKK